MKNKRLESIKLSIMLFLLVFILNSVIHMTKYMFSSAMADIVEDGIMTKSQTGAISAMFWFVYAIFQVFGGFAADKFSPSKLITIGVVGGILSNLVIFYNHSYPVIITVWCVNAAFQFGVWPASFKIVSTHLNHELSDAAVFWILFATSVGQALSMLIASFVPHWHYNFLISVIMLTVILVIWLVCYRQFENKMTFSEISMPVRDQATSTKNVNLSTLMNKSGLYVVVFVCFFVFAVCNGMKIVTPVMLMESYDNLPAAIATRMSVVLILFSVIGMFVSNMVRLKITENEMKGTALLFAVCVPMLALSYFVGKLHYTLILLFLSLAIVCIQGASPLTYSFVSARFTKYGKVGTVSGILNGVSAMGNVFASYVFPKMSEHFPWSTVTASWLVSAVLVVAFCLCVTPRWTAFIKNKNI